ncbi:hypothetical protein ACFWBN_13215 [Streptomyces sp. NPDC059989]|uniref:hypothetical protein n=1 Tax=Streptomyces sp. NPDC059989 TaxID=3347026 RepID=UPI00369F08F0
METLAAAGLAIFGTLAGAVAHHLLQSRVAHRAEVFARSERLRQDRMVAYGDFAKAIMSYRRAEFVRWEQLRAHSPEPDVREARSEAHLCRTVAWHAMFRLQLLADDPGLISLANRLLDITSDLHHAEDGEDLQRRGSLVREELARLMGMAADGLR